MIIWYRNSFLASVVAILGSALALIGIVMISEGEVAGAIAMIAIGVALVLWGKKISRDKAFKTWWKQITDHNLEPAIAQDISIAITIYNKNPEKRTLDKIARLNPAAAAQIRQ